jgi:hypothetical protein
MTPPCQLWSVHGSSSALALRLAVGADGLIDTRAWPTRAGARRAVVEYIAWYNGTGCTHPSATKVQPTTKTTTMKMSGE